MERKTRLSIGIVGIKQWPQLASSVMPLFRLSLPIRDTAIETNLVYQ